MKEKKEALITKTNKKLNIKYVVITLITAIFMLSRFYNLSRVPAWEDNFSWLYRINYYPWLLESNFKGIAPEDRGLDYAGKTSYHPGVTVMSLSGLTTKYGKKLVRNYIPNYETCEFNEVDCPYLSIELVLAKIPLIISFSVILWLILLLIAERFNFMSVLIFGIIIIFEPIFIFTSKDLHLDFMQSIFLLLTLLLFLRSKKHTETFNTLIGGFSYGIAVLTRFASIISLPAFLVINLINKKLHIKSLLFFIFTAIFTFFILYPPMWVAPIQTVDYIISGSLGSTKDHSKNDQNSTYMEGFSIYILIKQ